MSFLSELGSGLAAAMKNIDEVKSELSTMKSEVVTSLRTAKQEVSDAGSAAKQSLTGDARDIVNTVNDTAHTLRDKIRPL